MILILFLTIFAGACLLSQVFIQDVIPFFIRHYQQYRTKKTTKITRKLEDISLFWEKKKITFLFLAPPIFMGLGFLFLNNVLGLALGFVLGLVFPTLLIKIAIKRRLMNFQGQMLDALNILSASLKAGLSFIQAIEVLCEEMAPPISQEFNLVLKENKMGVVLDVSLDNLRKRIPLKEVDLTITSLLIARETGGELPKVLARLTETIRDNLKLKEKISTLTLQGRLQGIIMMALPFVFCYFLYKQNPEHLSIMWQSEKGRLLLFIAAGAQIMGMYLIRRISSTRI